MFLIARRKATSILQLARPAGPPVGPAGRMAADGRLNKAGAVLVRGSTAPELIVLGTPTLALSTLYVNVCAHRWLGRLAADGGLWAVDESMP